MYHAANKALHQFLLSVILPIYLKTIKQDTLDFYQCTTLLIMNNLLDYYSPTIMHMYMYNQFYVNTVLLCMYNIHTLSFAVIARLYIIILLASQLNM